MPYNQHGIVGVGAILLLWHKAAIINDMRVRRVPSSSVPYGTSFLSVALATLLLVFAAALPLSHQLFHDASVEPDWCPALAMEGALGLLLAFALSLLFFHPRIHFRAVLPGRLSRPLFRCATFHEDRAPPRF